LGCSAATKVHHDTPEKSYARFDPLYQPETLMGRVFARAERGEVITTRCCAGRVCLQAAA
jgi:hypothetical protein